VELERDGDVCVLRLGADENRLNDRFVAAFGRALDELEGGEGPAALVTTGAGKFYSNGLDLAWLSGEGAARAGAFLAEVHRLWARLLAAPFVTVAAMNGHAVAAGGMLALAHDFRVMRADRGFFCLPEIDLAMAQPLTDGMYALLSAKLPKDVFHEALVTGHRYGGAEAAARGIVHEAAPESEVLPRAVERARPLAGKHRATLRALRRGLYRDALAVLEREGA